MYIICNDNFSKIQNLQQYCTVLLIILSESETAMEFGFTGFCVFLDYLSLFFIFLALCQFSIRRSFETMPILKFEESAFLKQKESGPKSDVSSKTAFRYLDTQKPKIQNFDEKEKNSKSYKFNHQKNKIHDQKFDFLRVFFYPRLLIKLLSTLTYVINSHK